MADERKSAADLAARLDETGQLLVRSGIEIEHTLLAMQASGDALSVDLPSDEHVFISRVLEVDPQNGTMTIEWSGSKEANAQITDMRSVGFTANHEGLHLQFFAEHPHQTDFGNRSAIQFALPKSMLAAQRRAQPRYKVPPVVPLRCEISLGAISFEALVVDVGLGGIGAIVYDPAIRLEIGMIVPRATILLPSHPPVLAGLEVRHIGTVARADGGVAMRAGCRFIAPSAGIEAMVRLFLAAIEAAPGKAS